MLTKTNPHNEYLERFREKLSGGVAQVLGIPELLPNQEYCKYYNPVFNQKQKTEPLPTWVSRPVILFEHNGKHTTMTNYRTYDVWETYRDWEGDTCSDWVTRYEPHENHEFTLSRFNLFVPQSENKDLTPLRLSKPEALGGLILICNVDIKSVGSGNGVIKLDKTGYAQAFFYESIKALSVEKFLKIRKDLDRLKKFLGE